MINKLKKYIKNEKEIPFEDQLVDSDADLDEIAENNSIETPIC